MKPRDDTKKGMTVVLIVIVVVFTFLLWMPSCVRNAHESDERFKNEAVEEIVWHKACDDIGGTEVYNYKGSPSNLCFRPDGRLFSTR